MQKNAEIMGSVITIGLAASFLNNLTIDNAVVDGDHCNHAAFNPTLRETAFNGVGGYSDKQLQLL